MASKMQTSYSRTKAQKHIKYASWTDFIFQIQKGRIGNKQKNIFRGQSNFQKGSSVIWDIKSSFNRTFDVSNFLKNKYAEYGNIKNYLKLYKTSSTDSLHSEISFLKILEFFQHYSIPTPLIDFTTDPLVALYFALSPIPSYSMGMFGDKRKRYLTVIEIDLEVGEQYFKLQGNNTIADILNTKIEAKDKDEYNLLLEKTKKDYDKIFRKNNMVIDFFFEPDIQINPNLFRQKGVFLYLDSNKSFEDILEETVKSHKLKLSDPFLIKHHIPYDSCYVLLENGCLNIFSYLQFKQKTGIYLFENDIQGLKNDLFNGNFTYPLECLGKIKTCECRNLLVARKIFL
jgi:FRG domain